MEVEFPPERPIARQGEVGTGFFLIVRGRVRVVHDGVTIAHLGPGEVFGEISVLDQMPRIASVIAVEPTICLGVASWDFERLLEEQPTGRDRAPADGRPAAPRGHRDAAPLT